MSEKPVFEQIAQIQRSYVPICGHVTFGQPTSALAMTINQQNQNNSNDVNKIRPSVQLLTINILCYFVIKK